MLPCIWNGQSLSACKFGALLMSWLVRAAQQEVVVNPAKDLLDISDLLGDNSQPTCQWREPTGKVDDAEFVGRLQCPAEEPALEKALSFWWGGMKLDARMFAEFCNRVAKSAVNAGRVAPLYAFSVILFEGQVYMHCCTPKEVCRMFSEQGFDAHPDLRDALGLLQDLLTVVDLQMQFLLTYGDEPFTSQVLFSNVPAFHPSGSEAYWTIPWPSVYHTRTLLNGELDRENMTTVAWEDKIGKAWWRGTLTGPSTTLLSTAPFHPRVRILRMAAEEPELLDAGVTRMHPTLGVYQWGMDNAEKVLRDSSAQIVPHAEFWSHAPRFKYILVLPGITQSPQLSQVLRTGSVPLLVWDITYEHLFPLLTQWVHFVPIRSDLADLKLALKLLREDDARARQIAENAVALARKRLRPEFTYCYLWRGLRGVRDLTAEQSSVMKGAVSSGVFVRVPQIDLKIPYPEFTPIRDRLSRVVCDAEDANTSASQTNSGSRT